MLISHGHPDLSKGGAEIVAHSLFKEYQSQGLDTLLLARAQGSAHGGSVLAARDNERELLFHTEMGNFFLFQNASPRHVWHDFRHLLERYRPTVVHFHHFLQLGLEMIREVRNTVPDARIILTFHEYLAICANNGQMVTTDGNRLCYRASPSDCARCFPERSSGEFFLREFYIKSILGLVDQFVSPSRFLMERYVSWGMPPEKFSIIENGQPEMERIPARPVLEGEMRGRVGFFGQINPYKGIDILLDAFKALPLRFRSQLHLGIHGANLDLWTDAFKQHVETLLEQLKDTATFHGPYDHHEMPALLAEVDWVIVPSTWWENSPLVIQECLNMGRPLIVADIGGMAEKVQHTVNGYTFHARSPRDLARIIEHAANIDDERYLAMLDACRAGETRASSAEKHLRVYDHCRPYSFARTTVEMQL